MAEEAVLHISLAWDVVQPPPGERAWNVYRGGPAILLRFLETQLGLPAGAASTTARIANFAGMLDGVPHASFAPSLATDRWATAGELLVRWEELRLAGWDGQASAALPPLVRDLAKATGGKPLPFPDEAGRLCRVLTALDAGQRLPAHKCVLLDPVTCWPRRWQDVLNRLDCEDASAPAPGAPKRNALRTAQEQLLGGTVAAVAPDVSLQWVRFCSVLSACEAIACALAAEPDELADTVICCENQAVALCLDGCLARRGLPTTGASARSMAHPALQVLPLALRLCWEPVDPAVLLDFLTLPLCPLPSRARWRLARALAEQPGLGSEAWEAAWAEVTAPATDPDGETAARLRSWLTQPRTPLGQPLSAKVIAECCKAVAQWARGIASLTSRDGNPDLLLIDALTTAAGQAADVGEVVAAQGVALSEPQLFRRLDTALSHGLVVQPRMEATGGPTLASGPERVAGPAKRLIWLGLGTAESGGTRWTALERKMLAEAGIGIDDGGRLPAARHRAGRLGLCGITKTVLAVSLPSDAELRPHPMWLEVRGALQGEDKDIVVTPEDQFSADARCRVGVWRFPNERVAVQTPQPPRATWSIPAELLADRATSSATELMDRLGCPLKWVLQRCAGLRPGPIVSLPEGFTLKGDFCHWLLRRVFSAPGPLPSEQEAEKRICEAFDERLPLDAAPLAQPHRAAEAAQLRQELRAATRALVGALHRGGYRIKALESEISGELSGRTLNGRIDCLAATAAGDEAVIDFKYGGRGKYTDLLRDGRAVQLATYAYSRSTVTGHFPAVAYLLLSDGLLLTPQGSCLRGASPVRNAPDIRTVWDAFRDALARADGWLTTGDAVPVRPLQEASDWPEGVALVLEGPNSKGEMPERQRFCEYCDYQALCGMKELA